MAAGPRDHVGLIGFEYWCNVVRDYLNGSRYQGHYVGGALASERGSLARWRMLRQSPWRDLRIVHSVNALAGLRALMAFRLRGCQVVLHWIGSDYRRLHARHAGLQAATRAVLGALNATHLIDSPELADDLAQIGIRGEVLRLVPQAVDAEIMPLPPEPAALAYWSDGREDFYGRPIIYALARQWPEVPFRIVGSSSRDPDAPPNVEFLGFRTDLDPVYAETSILIRVLEHDSISAMVLEALARGRDVIYSRDFPGTRRATDKAGAIIAMRAHVTDYRANTAGADYVREHFAPRRWAELLCSVYGRILERRDG